MVGVLAGDCGWVEQVAAAGALALHEAVEGQVEGNRGEAWVGVLRDGQADLHGLFLADAIDAVGALVFDGGIPPAVEVDDVIGRRKREAECRPRGVKGGSRRSPRAGFGRRSPSLVAVGRGLRR